jgi:hypothetical protein
VLERRTTTGSSGRAPLGPQASGLSVASAAKTNELDQTPRTDKLKKSFLDSRFLLFFSAPCPTRTTCNAKNYTHSGVVSRVWFPGVSILFSRNALNCAQATSVSHPISAPSPTSILATTFRIHFPLASRMPARHTGQQTVGDGFR